MRLLLATLIACIAALPAAGAAEQPLGLVEEVDGKALVLSFPGARLTPGQVLAIYGPSQVRKHPLTGEIIVEDRKLVAKAQIIGGDEGRPQARVLWSSGEAVAPGYDAVPLPGEAAPNSPPAASAAMPAISAVGGSTVRIGLPIADPDLDQVTYSWSLEGPPGLSGRLDARTTGVPEIGWTAPELSGTTTLAVLARDSVGQEFTARVVLTSTRVEDAQKRGLLAFTRLGSDHEPAPSRLRRDGDGMWWGLDEGNARIVRIAPGWMTSETVAFAADGAPRRPIAIAPFRRELHVLDGSRLAVLVYGADGLLKRSIGAFARPTDLAIASDGTLFVADQGAGGVLIHEANGTLRGQLGREGKGADGFTGLTRIALDAAGNLYALDATQRQIARFDRFQRRLDGWTVQGDAEVLDIAVHAKGVLVLLASGAIQVFNTKGIANDALKPLAESQLVEKPQAPAGLLVDAAGEIFVTYPDAGLVARYAANGAVSGVRGGSLRALEPWIADGQGRLYGLDSDTAWIHQHDHEGWRIARFGGYAKTGGDLTSPVAMAISPDGAALAVVDGKKQHVVRYNLANPRDKPLVFGQPGKNNGQFTSATQIAMDGEGRAYVLDGDLYRVSVFDAKGGFLFAFGTYGKEGNQLRNPERLAASPAGDAVFVYDSYRYEVKKYALDQKEARGVHVTNAGGKGDGPCQFRSPVGLGCDRLGLLYVADGSRGDVQVIDFRGNNAVGLSARKSGEVGLKTIGFAAMAPDGQVYIGHQESLVGLRW